MLSNSFVLYVKLQRYHWYVQGKHFFTLHEKFEELYNMFAEDIDVIAERILMINGKPFATMQKFLEATSLEEASADDQETEMISQLKKDFKQMILEIKEEGIPLAEEQKDEPTLDMLIDIQGKLEKQVWTFKAYLSRD